MLTALLNSNWLFEQSSQFDKNLAISTNQHKLTYSQLKHEVEDHSSKLAHYISEDDIVGIFAEHSIQFVIDLFAVWNLGAIPCPINPKLTENERKQQINFIGCKIIDEFELKEKVDISFKNYSSEKSALIIFTSGSTNQHKGVVHTFKSLYSSVTSIDKEIQFTAGEKWLASLPFYRIGGFQIILRSLLSGGVLCIPSSPLSDELIKSSEKHKPQYISLVNASLKKIIDSGTDGLDQAKVVFVGGGPVDNELIKQALNKNIPVHKVYGSTETGSMISLLNPIDSKVKLNSAGKVLPGVSLHIIDNEICVLSDSNLKGYFKNSDLTDQRLRDKWFFTGDLGYIDTEGFLYVTGRKDNLIISGGEKVDPSEIENELRKLENIDKAYVFGIEDPKWGQKICAVVITPQPINKNEIRDKLKKHLSSYKIPKEIIAVKNVPLDEMGKVNINELKNLFL